MKNAMLERLITIGPKRAVQEELVKIAILLVILAITLPYVFR
jgi:hypothetical protein